MTSRRTVYLNGEFVPESEAKLSIYDLSVMQAAAAFEMTRSFNGVHFKLREHCERLKQSCESLSIPLPGIWLCNPHDWVEQLEILCGQVSRMNDHGPGEEHRLLIVVSPGCAPMYRDLDGVIPDPFLYIADFPLRYTVKGFSKYFTEGVHCVTSNIQQVPDSCVPSSAKHRSRLHFHLAQMQAPSGTWPLMRDDDGVYCEAPGANLAGVNEWDEIVTCEWNALPGISLATIKDLTSAKAASFYGSTIDRNKELWITGTPFCMLPVVSLDGKPIGDGKPGPVYKDTIAKWSSLVGLDIQHQIEEWDRC
jgi:branched-chain amino acid aminotransferase